MVETDWAARARREASAIIAEAPKPFAQTASEYDRMVTLVATGWIQGANYGAHEGIEAMGEAFATLRADLA